MRAVAYPGEDVETLASTSDIMPAYVYLMSYESANTNGQVINAH